MTSRNELDHQIADGKYYEDEPLFVVRACDPSAAKTVRAWVEDRRRRWRWQHPGESIPEDYEAKLDEALQCALVMEQWWADHPEWRNDKCGPVREGDVVDMRGIPVQECESDVRPLLGGMTFRHRECGTILCNDLVQDLWHTGRKHRKDDSDPAEVEDDGTRRCPGCGLLVTRDTVLARRTRRD